MVLCSVIVHSNQLPTHWCPTQALVHFMHDLRGGVHIDVDWLQQIKKQLRLEVGERRLAQQADINKNGEVKGTTPQN